MAIKDTSCSNHPDTIKALVGETIVGVIKNYEGVWLLVVKSGHAFALSSNGSFWVVQPRDVQTLIANRKKDLGAWVEETNRLMAIEDVLLAPPLDAAQDLVEVQRDGQGCVDCRPDRHCYKHMETR